MKKMLNVLAQLIVIMIISSCSSSDSQVKNGESPTTTSSTALDSQSQTRPNSNSDTSPDFEKLIRENSPKEKLVAVITKLRTESPVFGSDQFMGMEADALADFLVKLTSEIRAGKGGAESLKDRGFILASLHAFSMAEKDFSDAIKINENASDIYLFRGILRSLNQDFQRAIEDLNKAISLDNTPKDSLKDTLADAYLFRGLSKVMLEHNKEVGMADISKAVSITKTRENPFRKFVEQLGKRSPTEKVSVRFSQFEFPEYSCWLSSSGDEVIRSFYLMEAVGPSNIAVLWELRL